MNADKTIHRMVHRPSRFNTIINLFREVFWMKEIRPAVDSFIQKQLNEAEIALDIANTLKLNPSDCNLKILQRVSELLLLPNFTLSKIDKEIELFTGTGTKLKDAR